jgi:hypothetical protein
VPRPRKSTIDALVDAFAEMPLDAQDRAIDLMQYENRRARIRAARNGSAESKPAPESPLTADGSANKTATGAGQRSLLENQ